MGTNKGNPKGNPGARVLAKSFVAVDPVHLEWRDQALCTTVDPAMFFPDDGERADQAKRICAQCPVQPECLDYALAINDRHGIWGGLSPSERARIRRR